MLLIVDYDDKRRIFEGDDICELLYNARLSQLYSGAQVISFEVYDEVEDYGNKCGEC